LIGVTIGLETPDLPAELQQGEHPGVYPDGQLRTLQRRLKGWRREVAHTLVFGPAAIDEQASVASPTPLQPVT